MYEIIPYVGVGEIQFGMKCDEVCKLLGKDYKRIDYGYTTGYKLCFPNLNIYFDENEMLNAVEGNINTGFCYQGYEIVGKPFNKVYKYLKNFDIEIKMHSDGATSYKLGIGLYVPTIKKSKKELVQGVITFKKGYYGNSEYE